MFKPCLLDLRTKFQQRYADMPSRIAPKSWLSWKVCILRDSKWWSLNLTRAVQLKDKLWISHLSPKNLASRHLALPTKPTHAWPSTFAAPPRWYTPLLNLKYPQGSTSLKPTQISWATPPQRHGMLASVGLVTAHRIHGKLWVSKQHSCFLLLTTKGTNHPEIIRTFNIYILLHTSVLLRLVPGVPPTIATVTGSQLAMPLPASELHLLRYLCITEGSQKPGSFQNGIPNRIVWYQLEHTKHCTSRR